MEYTVKQMSKILDIKPRTVRQLGDNYGYGHKFQGTNIIVYTEEEKEGFLNRPHVGNPNWKKK
jgi:hypothetical protein